MSKTTVDIAPQVISVTITYDLSDLPTAQHKAGLAGLLLQIESMKSRQLPPEQIPEVIDYSATQATIRFTESSNQGLFDDLYDAEIVEVATKSKWAGTTPKREEQIEETDPQTQKVKRSKRFIYDVVQPVGHFLKQHLSDADGLWLKLWRNMVWDIPRSKPTTRGPYNSRSERLPCTEGPSTWKQLLAYDKCRKNNSFRTDEVSSALLLGAQAVNAESVPFQGRVEQTLLLHFWSLVVLINVPQQIDNDGERNFLGYSLSIPEVSDLEQFCEDYPRLLNELPKGAHGYRPAGAVIDIPAEAALQFLDNLARITQQVASKTRLRHSINSVEFLHLVKAGNNVKVMASGRIAADPGLLEKYRAIASPGQHKYRNPLFRAALLRSLLDDAAWYDSMSEMLVERPWPLFIKSEKTPRSMPWFSADAENRFKLSQNEYQGDVKVHAMTQNTTDSIVTAIAPLDILIYRLVSKFVHRKTEGKSDLNWANFKKTKDESGEERTEVPQAYRDAREKVVADAFLSMRSRREQDFVDYFTASICSVGQFLREDEYHVVAQALLRNPDQVKTLTMLALSANS
jgi:CRISPR-associated protein Cmx8